LAWANVNVLRGQMSLVGPRPLPLRDYDQLEDWHRKRYNVLPGVTGLWQISGRSNLSFDDLVRLDFYYLENCRSGWTSRSWRRRCRRFSALAAPTDTWSPC
jgi:lipopolysaccharide/colanic/teichoic acid biosynthesis glycosyltransferase